MDLKIFVTHPDLEPERAHPTDAGLDLKSIETVDINYRDVITIGTGVHLEIPIGYMGLVALRSSMGDIGLTMPNGVGIIDSDYRGEVQLILTNLAYLPYRIERGDRIAQLIITPITIPELIEVSSKDELSPTARGEKGIGSTGK